MAQKQKTLAKAGEANPDIFTVSRTGTTGYTHGHKPATGFLMESRMQGNCAPCHAQTESPPEVAGVQGK